MAVQSKGCSFRIPVVLWQKLSDQAYAERVGISVVLRKAVIEYLRSKGDEMADLAKFDFAVFTDHVKEVHGGNVRRDCDICEYWDEKS